MRVISRSFFDDRRATGKEGRGGRDGRSSKKNRLPANLSVDRRASEGTSALFQDCWYLKVNYVCEELSVDELVDYFRTH